MRSLIILGLLLYSSAGLAQGRSPRIDNLEITLGYGVSHFPQTRGGMAYLSAGSSTLGAALFFSGDANIQRGGHRVGHGSVGGFGWVKVLSLSELSLKLNAGVASLEQFHARENTLAEFGLLDPNTGQAELVSSSLHGLVGASVSWRFIELSYLSFSDALLLGLKLNY